MVATPRAVPVSPFACQRNRLSSDSALSLVGSPCKSSIETGCQLHSASLASPMLRSALYQPAQQSRQLSTASTRDSIDSLGQLEELMQQRELEDAELLAPYAGGTVGSTDAVPRPAALDASALPADLQALLVLPGEVELLRRPGKEGEDWVLGEGAR